MRNKTFKAIIYARCSTDEKRQDVEVQLKELRRECERNGWEHDEVSEYGSGYKEDKQPELDKIISNIRNYDAMLVYSMDRFSRKKPDEVNKMLIYIANDKKVRFLALLEDIDSNDEVKWNIVRHLYIHFANQFSKILGEKIKKGIARKKELGVYTGGRPEKKVDWAIIRTLQANGGSLRSIAQEINKDKPKKQRVSFQTINRLLQKLKQDSTCENEQIMAVT